MRTGWRRVLGPAILAALAGRAGAQPCEPAWTERFAPAGVGGGLPYYGRVYYSTVFDDDGAGPHGAALFLFGDFDSIAGVPMPSGIARWDGVAWTGVASPAHANNYSVANGHGAVVFDPDGPGPQPPALYAILAGGNVYRWDGASWTLSASLGYYQAQGHCYWRGFATGLFVVDPDGPGPAPSTLYAVQWNDSCDFAYGVLLRLDAGGGSIVTTTDWSVIDDLAAFDEDGAGPAPTTLYMTTVGGLNPSNVASLLKLVGSTWQPAAAPQVGQRYRALAVFDPDGPGPLAEGLYVGGLGSIYRLENGGLTNLGNVEQEITGLQVLDDDGAGPHRPALFVTGVFNTINGLNGLVPANSIAKFDGTNWSALGPGILRSTAWNSPVAIRTLIAFDDDGPGPRPTFLYAGGDFMRAGYAPARGIARWDGHFWEPPGPVVNNAVHALVSADLGAGPALYLGGEFTSADGLPAVGIARWNGQGFAQLSTGFNNHVDALAVYGGELYAAGKFTAAAGVPLAHIARWTGTNWADVGGGFAFNVAALAGRCKTLRI